MEQRKLSDEDKARIEQFLDTPVNRIKRKPFRPIYLLIMLLVVTFGLLVLSKWLAGLIGA